MDKITLTGLPVHLFTVDTLHESVLEAMVAEQRVFLHANAYLISLADHQPWLKDFFSGANTFVMCDGSGIQLAARLTGQKIPQKIPYNVWAWDFFKFLADNGLSIFLLGSSETVVRKAVDRIKLTPNVRVAGFHHGYFEKQGPENEAVVKAINESGADVIFVGFGMPLQEQWVRDNRHMLKPKAIFTCGGAFDFFSGNKPVAPRLIRSLHLEWLFRFLIEPVRLFRRAILTNLHFLYVVSTRGQKN